MSSKKKARGEEFRQEDVLQAVVIADSFNIRFAPVTHNKPRTLLPLVNTPLLDYTLEFLSTAGIQEAIIFCCAHADQIRRHVANSRWSESSSPMEVITLASETCLSLGDALREIDSQSLINNDFVLVNGDLVASVKLKPLIEQHKARRLKEKTPVMTMLLKRAPPGHRTRCQEDEVMVAVKKENNRILYFKKAGNERKFDFPVEIFEENSHIDLRYDLLNAHISICSPQVPTLFTDNFDYQTRADFVKGILDNEEILGNTIHLDVIEDEYAAGVSNLHMYDAVSKDVMQRWLYPMVPEKLTTGRDGNRYTYGRHNIYLQRDVTLERGCVVQENVAIGKNTTIGNNACISNSVIGNNCVIGENVKLEGAYIWDNVTIEDHCIVKTSLIDCDVHLKKNVTVQPGCVLQMKVIVGPDVSLPSGTLLSSKPQIHADDDFEDEEQGEDEATEAVDESLVGTNGVAYKYVPECDSDGEDLDDLWGLKVESDEDDMSSELLSDLEDGEFEAPEIADEAKLFYDEFIGTIERAMVEDIVTDHLVLEVNSLKAAYGLQIQEVNLYVTKGILEFPLHAKPELDPPQYLGELKRNFKMLLPLLRNYIRSDESQKDCLAAMEDLAVDNKTVRATLLKLLQILYNSDILGEDVLLDWHGNLSNPEDVDLRKSIRKQVQPFISWLQEAEEESDSD